MGLTNALNLLCDAALSLAYPQLCGVCGAAEVESRADSPACAACWSSTRVFTGAETLCQKCGAPAARGVPEGKRGDVRCRRCDAQEFTAARACGVYEGALRAAVLALKREPFVSQRVACLLRDAARRAPLDAATLVVPAPLHAERQRRRGFNHAAVLARAVAAKTGLRLDELSLVRTTHSERHRAGMDARARRESVEGAFAVARPRLVEGERVLLVDDVFTTGATASACAHALTAAGAAEVLALTLARAA